MKHNIRLKEGAQRTICAPRQVPHALRDKLKEELDRLEAEHIIAKVEKPTEWVNHIVNVLKPNKQLRICLDPQKLNEAIMREHYALPVSSEIVARIGGAKVYSTLDATAGFHQIELEEQSSYYATLITAYTCTLGCHLVCSLHLK